MTRRAMCAGRCLPGGAGVAGPEEDAHGAEEEQAKHHAGHDVAAQVAFESKISKQFIIF